MKKLMAIILCAAMLLCVCVTVNAETEEANPKLSKDLLERWIKETMKQNALYLIYEATDFYTMENIQVLLEKYTYNLERAIAEDVSSDRFNNILKDIRDNCDAIHENLYSIKEEVDSVNYKYEATKQIELMAISMLKEAINKFRDDMKPHIKIIDDYLNASNQNALSGSDS